MCTDVPGAVGAVTRSRVALEAEAAYAGSPAGLEEEELIEVPLEIARRHHGPRKLRP